MKGEKEQRWPQTKKRAVRWLSPQPPSSLRTVFLSPGVPAEGFPDAPSPG